MENRQTNKNYTGKKSKPSVTRGGKKDEDKNIFKYKKEEALKTNQQISVFKAVQVGHKQVVDVRLQNHLNVVWCVVRQVRHFGEREKWIL